jgi:hypothetical protein
MYRKTLSMLTVVALMMSMLLFSTGSAQAGGLDGLGGRDGHDGRDDHHGRHHHEDDNGNNCLLGILCLGN